MQKVLINRNNETTIKDLTEKKALLEKEPYTCHENICMCPVHNIGLEHLRSKYNTSDVFVGDYI